MDLKPLGNRVLIRPDVQESETDSGLIIPEVSRDQPEMSGIVISKGRGPASANRIRQATIARCIAILNQVADQVPAAALRSEAEDALARYASDLIDLSEVREGERVVFPYTGGETLTVDGQRFLIIEEDKIVASMPAEAAA